MLRLVILMVAGVTSVVAGSNELVEIVTIEPVTVHKPAGNSYAHGKLVPSNAVWLVTAGQTGMDPSGHVPEGIEAQADQAMKNLANVLQAASMTGADIVKMTIYYVDQDYLDIILAARNRQFGEDFRPASTVVVVKALARPKYLVEVEAIAARAAN